MPPKEDEKLGIILERLNKMYDHSERVAKLEFAQKQHWSMINENKQNFKDHQEEHKDMEKEKRKQQFQIIVSIILALIGLVAGAARLGG